MQELIKIQAGNIGGESIQTVDARNLHRGLQVRRDFSTWIKYRIESCRLVENQDYVVVTTFGENLQGGRPSKEYHLTLDAAKALAMLENNEPGYVVRALALLHTTPNELAAISYGG